MPIFDLYSKRQKRLRGEVKDVYRYDEFPDALLAQIVYIWNDTLGSPNDYQNSNVASAYDFIVGVLCREYGLFLLPGNQGLEGTPKAVQLGRFFLRYADKDQIVDVIEVTFKSILAFTRDFSYLGKNNASRIAAEAIDELNYRFKEHAVGYQFVDGQVMRIDSEFLHVEVVKPALHLLNQPEYAGAREEFLKAHEHYRKANAKEAMTECAKALESTLKTVCSKRNWSHDPNATAKTLIDICFDKGLIPPFWQSHFSSLRSLLATGVPTGRNKASAHGQGLTPTEVPGSLVAYMLHMTASTIVFLGEAETTP